MRCVICKQTHDWKHGDCVECKRRSCYECCGSKHYGIVCDGCGELGCNLCFEMSETLCNACSPRRSARLLAKERAAAVASNVVIMEEVRRNQQC